MKTLLLSYCSQRKKTKQTIYKRRTGLLHRDYCSEALYLTTGNMNVLYWLVEDNHETTYFKCYLPYRLEYDYVDIIFVNTVFYKCLSSILPLTNFTDSQICNYLPCRALWQRNPHVRTKFIHSIHKNHMKYPTELQFKCDYYYFFPWK